MRDTKLRSELDCYVTAATTCLCKAKERAREQRAVPSSLATVYLAVTTATALLTITVAPAAPARAGVAALPASVAGLTVIAATARAVAAIFTAGASVAVGHACSGRLALSRRITGLTARTGSAGVAAAIVSTSALLACKKAGAIGCDWKTLANAFAFTIGELWARASFARLPANAL
jgi:hypothetical protein